MEVHDPETYAKYIERAAPAYREFGARFLVRGGSFEAPEGAELGARHVVIEFESLERAKACYDSETYRRAREYRQKASTGHIIIVEGTQ